MNDKQLSIRLYGEPVGILEQTATGKMKFTYLDNAIAPISIGMPIREEAYDDLPCEAFFGGLLPENNAAKQLIGKKYGINANNSFALLKAIGYDCAGAISCHAINDEVVAQHSIANAGSVITEDELYDHIKELPKKPLFMDVTGLRLSLAGVHDKAAVCVINHQIALPENGCPTTHILKPAAPHFDGIVENEYFVMKIAKRIGLSVPEIELKKIKDINFLLIERYDRRIKNNYIERIHQEDFCQALGIISLNKYQHEGGPSLKDCFNLLNSTTQPAVSRTRLAPGVIFNYLIGNMDAHGKNFSLLHNTRTTTQLSPFYDMVCTRVYEALTTKMAMKIGNKYDADEVLPRHWQQLSEEIHYRYLSLANLIQLQIRQIKQAALEEKNELMNNGMYHPIIDQIIDFIDKNSGQTLRRFDEFLNKA